MTTTSNQCTATKRNGDPCGAWALTGSDLCWAHDPTVAKERKEASARGGRARHGRKLARGDGEPVALETVADVVLVLGAELGELLALETSVSRARAVGYLCGVVVKALEASDIEQRITALEQLQQGET